MKLHSETYSPELRLDQKPNVPVLKSPFNSASDLGLPLQPDAEPAIGCRSTDAAGKRGTRTGSTVLSDGYRYTVEASSTYTEEQWMGSDAVDQADKPRTATQPWISYSTVTKTR